jgi:glutathione S-transferase
MLLSKQRLDIVSSRLASKLRLDAARAAAPRSSPPPSHHLILYEYEASPWCRLVREQLTILDLDAHIRPCPRQTLLSEGAFSASSRFRPEAMNHYLKDYSYNNSTDDLTFPLLVDQTTSTDNDDDDPVVICQSYEILHHLWENYGKSVLPSSTSDETRRRPDQRVNAAHIPFPIRFLSLAGPSYLRPFPTCGLLQTPSTMYDDGSSSLLTLYQAEGCPESRLVREVLCTLELPYKSVSTGKGTTSTPFLFDDDKDDTELPVLVVEDTMTTLQGAKACTDYLWERYWDPKLNTNNKSSLPSWFDPVPTPNLGRAGSFSVGAYTAFLKGSRALVPPQSLE